MITDKLTKKISETPRNGTVELKGPISLGLVLSILYEGRKVKVMK